MRRIAAVKSWGVIMIKIIFDPEKGLLVTEVDGKKPLSLKISEDPSPLELLLISLGACAAITVYKSLVIRGGKVKRIGVTLTTRAITNKENSLEEVMIEYSIAASDITAKEAEEVVNSSLQGECIVAKILSQKIKCYSKVKFRKIKE